MDIDEILKEIFATSPVPPNLRNPKRKFEKGELGYNSKIRIVEKYTDYNIEIKAIIVKTVDELLNEIFGVSPLPNKLKVPKRAFEKGELKYNSKIRIIKEYSEYNLQISCYKNDELI